MRALASLSVAVAGLGAARAGWAYPECPRSRLVATRLAEVGYGPLGVSALAFLVVAGLVALAARLRERDHPPAAEGSGAGERWARRGRTFARPGGSKGAGGHPP